MQLWISKGRPLAAALVMSASLAQAANASEGSVYGGPTGGTDIRNAYLPAVSGFYSSAVGISSFSTATHDQYGNAPANSVLGVTSGVAALSLTYVYPFKLSGWTMASTVQEGGEWATIAVNGKQQNVLGLFDTYVEFAALSKNFGFLFGETLAADAPKLPYGLAFKASYSMIFPTGQYNSTVLLAPGHNDFFFIPNFALTYLTAPNFLGDGLELSAHMFFDIASKNPVTDYSSGTVIDTDFAVTERRGKWQGGLIGYYATQVNNDIKDGAIVSGGGKKLTQFYLGPIIAYDFPDAGTVKLKVQFPIETKNALNTKRVFLTYGWKW